ncbi:S-layer homology domain-containing protein [Meiothermus granaticius]|uniref:S-layer homology domain-containing protein n=1 Tax=Meiothermus granaticius TaxID=863370 RepID=UPI00118FBFB4|nr:S-layer homology domain-containing protein [Meiothermus granaticius]GEM86247.1 S-layer protein [Meiothermus granaticius NBRC 107808]
MKQKLVVYLAGLLTVVGLGFGQAQFSDVPAGHWAKEAVDRIAACGLIIGFPDGTFRGNQNLTRYQAALIFQRLLTELEKGGQCVSGGQLSSEDLTTIRNGVQELAAELAALGVRVSALEDNAASKDDIAQLQAAIDELKSQSGQSGMSEDALKDLADRVEAASVAADTALAQSQILGDRLDGVEGDVAALKTQVDANGDSIKALNELAVLLNQDVLSLQDRVTALESSIGSVDVNSFATKEDVNAVQEFATALRGDLVALTDKVNGIDTRVQKLEAVQFSLTGSLAGTYGYTTNTGGDFDIDRLFPNNILSSGVGPSDGGSIYVRPKWRRGDMNQDFTEVDLNLNFGVKFNNVGATGISDVTINSFTPVASPSTSGGVPAPLRMRAATINGKLDNQPFSVQYYNSDQQNLTFVFNPYLFNNADNGSGDYGDTGAMSGAIATLNGTNWPLSPKFTVVMGNANTNTTNNAGYLVFGDPANPGNPTDFFGTRAEVNLLGLNLGLNYAENRFNRAGFGVDWKGTLFGLLSLEGAYDATKSNADVWDFSNPATTPQAFYINGGVNLGILSLNANYRAIAPLYEGGVAGMSLASSKFLFGVGGYDNAPYAPDSRGFGVDGKIKLANILSGIELRGYYDSATNLNGDALSATNYYGVGGDIGLFAGLKLNAFYNNFTVNGNQYPGSGFDALATGGGAIGNFGNFFAYTYNNQDSRYSSGFGVRLTHDPKASNALVPGLDVRLGYQQFANTGTDILAAAAYSGKLLGFLNLNPVVRYHSFSGSVTSYLDYDGATTIPVYSSNTLKFGIGVTTDPANFFLKPSLDGGFSTRTTNYTAGPAGDPLVGNSTTETYWRVGINLNEFLVSGSVLKAGYAQYSGTNILSPSPTSIFPARGYTNAPFGIGTDRIFTYPGEVQYPWNNTVVTGRTYASGGLGGLYLEWAYGNLQAGAFIGSLTDANGNAVSQGSGFKVTYTINF